MLERKMYELVAEIHRSTARGKACPMRAGMKRVWMPMPREYKGYVDTTLTPPRAKYAAIRGKAEQRLPLGYVGPATMSNPLQRLTYPS